MKSFLSTILALVAVVLVVSLVLMKRSDNAQHETDAGAINDYSNRLDSAQTKIAIGNGTILTLSNSLNECQSASLTLSNHLGATESAKALDTERITSLNRHVAELETENQSLSRRLDQRVMELTDQMAVLTSQLASTQASLTQTNKDLVQAYKDYGLLENRLRRDVAERVVLERKYHNVSELQARMQYIKANPDELISAESIYSGLDVEVNSNGTAHVISPN
ncbi:MAG TPA: hypothetical protein VIK53_01205 [Verrucomicrobiae bacterium]